MIEELAQKLQERSRAVDDWYRDRLKALPGAEPPVYSSVDVRNSGFKIGVVDTNLFPAGFNNLCETYSDQAAVAFREFFRKWHPSVGKVLLLPEEHTRNLFYWKNVDALVRMLEEAGIEVRVGSASTQFSDDPFVIPLAGPEENAAKARQVSVQKIDWKDGFLRTGDFVPDLILINNDLSGGIPDYLKDVKQILLPSPYLGWHSRRKSEHFHHNALLLEEVSRVLDMDPWLMGPVSSVETGVDLTDEICLKRLKDAADRLLDRIREKYRQYGIAKDPYLFVKSDSGTYGMGLIHVDSGDRLLSLNRKLRNKLESSKGGRRVGEYLLQEGIPTADLYRGKPIEPVVYLVGGEAVGTFFRIHDQKDEKESLNAPGMSFACLCFHQVKPSGKTYHLTCGDKNQMFAAAAFLGKVASLASVLELHRLQAHRTPARSA
ncbi:MAG TPA: glutamate--cysteine ligase [bacterium]|nr:glutamate--cysteine ligase [bacterium]